MEIKTKWHDFGQSHFKHHIFTMLDKSNQNNENPGVFRCLSKRRNEHDNNTMFSALPSSTQFFFFFHFGHRSLFFSFVRLAALYQ